MGIDDTGGVGGDWVSAAGGHYPKSINIEKITGAGNRFFPGIPFSELFYIYTLYTIYDTYYYVYICIRWYWW